MKTCAIHIASGIGNVIQSIPFIMEMKDKYDKVYPYYKSNELTQKAYGSVMSLIGHLFDSQKMPKNVDKIFYSPVEGPKRRAGKDWRIPEYKMWFKMHGFEQPEQYRYDVKKNQTVNGYQYILWPGCKPNWKSKMWPHWIELAKSLHGNDIAVVGLKEDGPKQFPSFVDDLRGKLTLDELAGLLSASQHFIGNEGGISHLAAVVCKRTYIIYGATSPLKNFPPKRDGLYMISLNLPCQPCQFSKTKAWPPAKGCGLLSCLVELTPSMVKAFIFHSKGSLSTDIGVANGRM